VPEVSELVEPQLPRASRHAGSTLVSPDLPGDLAAAVAAFRRVLRQALRGRVPGTRLPAAEVELLVTVIDVPGVGVNDAARALGLAPNTVSTLVSRLVEKGLIARRSDPDDGRVAQLWPTSTGRSRISRWRDHRAEAVGEALASLAAADLAALAQAVPALERLTGALHTAVDKGASR
jgi:DNA-binding MarR family transcriptional regulator